MLILTSAPGFTLQKFAHDASSLARSLPSQPFDGTVHIRAVAVKFDTALKKSGVEGCQNRESVFNMATHNIGLKWDKRQVRELRK